MFYTNEDLALKKEDKSPDYIYLPNITKDLCIDEKFENFIKGSGSYNRKNDFEETVSLAVVDDDVFNNSIFELNSNKEKEEEEDYKHYYHSSTTTENPPSKTESQKVPLFPKRDDPDAQPNGNPNFRNNIRNKEKQPRYKNNDNVRRIIKRRFFNTYLKDALNKKLKKLGYKELFRYFPQKLVGEITKKKNKELMNMTLFQIIEKNDSYIKKDLINFEYNLEIIKKIKTDEKAEIYFILNKKFSEIFEEYVNSDAFKEEIVRLNSKHKNEEFYLQRYEYLAKNFVRFYSQ